MDPTKPEAVKPGEAKEAESAPVALTADDIKVDLPEGITLQDEALTNFLTAANEAKLPKENAQAFLKMHVEQVNSLVSDWVKAQEKTWNDTNAAWRGEILADKVLGSGNETQVQATLGRAFDAFGDDTARKAFDLTGAGNNPNVVRMFYKMAQALEEGGLKAGGNPAPKGGPKGNTLGERLYGT